MPVLFTFNLQTKFEMSSFIRSKNLAWAPKCRNGPRDPNYAHLANSYTKFQNCPDEWGWTVTMHIRSLSRAPFYNFTPLKYLRKSWSWTVQYLPRVLPQHLLLQLFLRRLEPQTSRIPGLICLHRLKWHFKYIPPFKSVNICMLHVYMYANVGGVA